MKYIVSMKVEGRIDVEVEAENSDEAFEKAKNEFMNIEIGKDNFEFVDSEPVNCSDENGNLTDYR